MTYIYIWSLFIVDNDTQLVYVRYYSSADSSQSDVQALEVFLAHKSIIKW